MISIMQPYYLPFIGYFQLINYVDTFVIFDDTQFVKNGFGVQNKIGSEKISINIQKRNKLDLIYKKKIFTSLYQAQIEKIRDICKDFKYYDEKIFDKIFEIPSNESYFEFLFNQIKFVCEYLSIKTNILKSSEIYDTSDLKKQSKIYAICKKLNEFIYINPIGGKDLYSEEQFMQNKIRLQFFNYKPFIGKKEDLDSILKIIFCYDIIEIKKSLLID